MDKEIAREVVKAKQNKTIVYAIVIVLALAIALWLLRSSIKSSLDAGSFTTSVVEVGSIENTITATGEVLPEFEQVITSPINAAIKEVSLDAGTHVKAGQSILALDKQASQNDYEKLEFQLESKRNSISKMRLELNKSFFDIRSNNDIKQLRINSLEASVEDAKRLFKAGGGTREQIAQAELALKVALLEKKQLENEITSKQQTMKVDIRESEIAAAIQESDLRELGRKLQQATITASREGVITWVNKNIGSSIKEGESLVRIADLKSFKITGSVSDAYLDKVKTGMRTIVRINDSTIRGTITNVNPSVQNGIVAFDIGLDERDNSLLRPNMKVDVYLVTASENKTMRVANGPAFKGSSTQDIFVIRNGKAFRTTVDIGMTNFDYVEIKNNVKPGDVIITSDMSQFKNAKEIIINNQPSNETKTTATYFHTTDMLFAKLGTGN
ncbi:HlyD family efflux transporter periplasmic adaptor subunit [Segetibacter sp. 3557_3]|uniref:efflux RND transporter periplasmic adaptor subunit n=1 Tax=Segetibacter sp. 3557_3 TaxID=2547429 RepID=UPI001058B4CF|nr:HlyD family efflux transporter periplasmic adaptor subunit [Segetibacter sp. 3557_3]TDH21647.1 HlyD family efflux transporter periplasmic adaptor subunit [Segetibacter sp. 3557_3]